MEKELTKKEVLAIISKVTDKEKKKAMLCALVGHSRIQETFWGYYNCARCGAKMGDTLASVYMGATEAVVVGHNCPKCRANYKKCSWKDKLLAPNPFKKAKKRKVI